MNKYYRHFKGNIYKLIGIAKDSETLEEKVVYQAMYGERDIFVPFSFRPIEIKAEYLVYTEQSTIFAMPPAA